MPITMHLLFFEVLGYGPHSASFLFLDCPSMRNLHFSIRIPNFIIKIEILEKYYYNTNNLRMNEVYSIAEVRKEGRTKKRRQEVDSRKKEA